MSVDLGGIRMKNPVMTASGTFGYGPEYADLIDLNALGAIVVKGISLHPVKGNPPPRTVETASGLINAIGLQNPGVDGFIREYVPFLRRFDTPVIVNIWGRTIEEYEQVAERFDATDGIAGLEINVSCPNIKEGSCMFSSNIEMFRRVVAAVRRKTKRPMIPKLAPDHAHIADFAKAAEACGADAISLINTLPAMAIDAETRRPILGNKTGGLSGPAIKPVAVKQVWDAARAVRIPVVGIGGIYSATDALEFIIAGATAVAVGTANFTQPSTALEVVEGLRSYLARHNLASVRDLVGSLQT
ncbi:MAG: Dihydroorotate dehydrogenase B (NAD(+)), catalytic subunit [Verrucomicrobia bacterium ADurb.Bin345]|nr:MAG: Dihydroorotate dehydrogenase B (NAD(+)), catalytic subunit [Verrucomicrobia bacterium ADurb.Bin345]